MILQVAMALVLLVGSGLMARSFWQLRNVDTGFDPEGVLTVRLSLPPAEYPENRAIADFYQSLVSGLAGRPGVTNVGAISGIPLSDSKNAGDVGIEDYPIGPDDLPPVIEALEAMTLPEEA